MVTTEIRLIIFFSAEDGEALYSQQKQDWELTVAQIVNSLLQNSGLNCKGKTTRPFRYNLNQIQILYDYTVEVTNRFKGLDLVDRVPEQLWTNCHGSGTTSMNWRQVHNTVQEVVTKTIPKKNKEGKVVWGCLRRPYKQLRKEKWKAKEKGKDGPKWMQS